MEIRLECEVFSEIADLWRWSCSLQPRDLLENIVEVVYTLDPSFRPPVRRTKDRATCFRIEDVTSCSFQVYASARFADGSQLRLQGEVRFDQTELERGRSENLQSKNPVLLVVDDDESVLLAIFQDLRRRYGRSYRILRAPSGTDGLKILRDLQTDDEDVALVISDQRMPLMTGTEFLAQVSSIYPTAKKILLTAYGDSGALVDCINVVRLDRYMFKPWDPPEEKLYPYLDELLEDWSPVSSKIIRRPVMRLESTTEPT